LKDEGTELVELIREKERHPRCGGNDLRPEIDVIARFARPIENAAVYGSYAHVARSTWPMADMRLLAVAYTARTCVAVAPMKVMPGISPKAPSCGGRKPVMASLLPVPPTSIVYCEIVVAML